MTPRSLRRALLVSSAGLVLALSVPAARAAEGVAGEEIDHLLTFVAASSCTFVRNGTEFPSDKAREHLATKYRVAGSRIENAEAFIKHLATQSSMSGEPYHVKCGKTDELAGVWLANELARFRKAPRVQASR
jgi:hypothetical protein